MCGCTEVGRIPGGSHNRSCTVFQLQKSKTTYERSEWVTRKCSPVCVEEDHVENGVVIRVNCCQEDACNSSTPLAAFGVKVPLVVMCFFVVSLCIYIG